MAPVWASCWPVVLEPEPMLPPVTVMLPTSPRTALMISPPELLLMESMTPIPGVKVTVAVATPVLTVVMTAGYARWG